MEILYDKDYIFISSIYEKHQPNKAYNNYTVMRITNLKMKVNINLVERVYKVHQRLYSEYMYF